MRTFQRGNNTYNIVFDKYPKDTTCINIVDAKTKREYSNATLHILDIKLEANEVIINDRGKNKGILGV